MTDHPTARDWQNRAERAEAECNELRENVARLKAEKHTLTMRALWLRTDLANVASRIPIEGESNGQ